MKEQKVLIARQPIFTGASKLFGYELLYRDTSSGNAYSSQVDGARATCEVLSRSMVTFGLKKLTKGNFAFVNFPRELLLSRLPDLLSPREIIIEVLEDTGDDPALLERLDDLRAKGFLLALDDYDGSPRFELLLEHVDIIKVDFILTDPPTRKKIASRFGGKKQLLAEKVETREEYGLARQYGYDLFQGYFFSKPVVLSQKALDISSPTYLRIWREMTRDEPDLPRLAQIIESDVNLTYKFLVRINTLHYYLGNRVKSIRHAVVRMGYREIRRWLLLLLIRDVMGKQTDEAVRVALVRGVFAERMAGLTGRDDLSEDAYMAGLFSMIPDILGQGMTEALAGLQIPPSVRAALCGRSGVLKNLVDFVICYESGAWEEVSDYLLRNAVAEAEALSVYAAAVHYADMAFSDTAEPEPGIARPTGMEALGREEEP